MIYLDLMTGSVRALLDAIQAHNSETDKRKSDRDAHQIARTVDSAYLTTDRWLKALISTIDSYLLLSNPSRTLIQNLRAAMLNNDSTSIFTCGAEFDSLNAVETAKLLSAVIRPKISDESHSAFVAALKAVATLRNNVQHGELYGDGDELLGFGQETFGRTISAGQRRHSGFPGQGE
jgi:hypothetical protein